ALGVDTVAGRETRHPARTAAELDHRGARAEVEQFEDVRKVDQQARRLARRLAERLRPEPGAALLADRLRVLDLRSLPFGVRHLRGSVTQTSRNCVALVQRACTRWQPPARKRHGSERKCDALAAEDDRELRAGEIARTEAVER